MGKRVGGMRGRVLEFVRRRIEEGEPPSIREVQRAMGFRAVESAREHLDALVVEGALVKASGKARGYRLPEGQLPRTMTVPLVGRVQAGALAMAMEQHEGNIPIEARRAVRSRTGKHFALRVRGDSMINAAILDGDIVVVRQGSVADNGDIVVALVGEEATVKRLRVLEDRVELLPENPAYAPIVIEPPAEPYILGRVIEVRRYLDGHRFGAGHGSLGGAK